MENTVGNKNGQYFSAYSTFSGYDRIGIAKA